MENSGKRMGVTHHDLDIKPIPEQVLYINEPHITGSFCGSGINDLNHAKQLFKTKQNVDNASWYARQSPDHVRVYVPLDLSKECILAYFRAVLGCFGHADEKNETRFSCAVDQVLTRLEIYDQVWFVREMSQKGYDERTRPNSNGLTTYHHSRHGAEIARVIVDELIQLSDNGCTAECFPYETIDLLCKEYRLNAEKKNIAKQW